MEKVLLVLFFCAVSLLMIVLVLFVVCYSVYVMVDGLKQSRTLHGVPKSNDIIDKALAGLWRSSAEFEDIGKRLDDDFHDTITRKVFRRLLLRHSVLNKIAKINVEHAAHAELDGKWPHGILKNETIIQKNGTVYVGSGDKCSTGTCYENLCCVIPSCLSNAKKEDTAPPGDSSEPFVLLPAQVRAYNLAVTDLFVEKALTYLAKSERWYRRAGKICCNLAFVVLAIGALVASVGLLPSEVKEVYVKKMIQCIGGEYKAQHVELVDRKAVLDEKRLVAEVNSYVGDDLPTKDWKSLVYVFAKAFTAYGMIVGFAVALLKLGRTMMEQYEKIAERRHALRQGRLFVHLNGGKLSIDELDKAFNWNSSYDNAFSKVSFDAQAPWGRFSKDMFESLAEVAKTGISAVQKTKTGEK